MNRKLLTLCTTVLSVFCFSAIASESPRERLPHELSVVHPDPRPCPRPVELSILRAGIQSPLPGSVESPIVRICLQ